MVLDARTVAADARSAAELGALRAALVKLVGADHGDQHAAWRKALASPKTAASPEAVVTPPAYDATKPTQPIK